MSKGTGWRGHRWLQNAWNERYLLRDEFNSPLAAGSVNGTAAEPGPGTRTVVDTDTTKRLSIVSGALSVTAHTTPAWGDPGLWLDAVTREAGRAVVAEFTTANYASHNMIGWDTNQSGAASGGYSYNLNSGIINGDQGAFPVGVFVVDTSYKLAFVLRATGCFSFIKGGAFTNWTLLRVWAAGTASMYPTIVEYSMVFTSKFLRVPRRLWLPVPIASDGFGTAFGTTDGAGHAETSGIGAGGGGLAWSPTATWSIASSKALNTPTLGSELATGNLVVGTWYEITATQANYFYTGCAIGHTFRATATTALDANNKVKAITLATLFSSLSGGTADVVPSVAAVVTAGTQAGMILNLDSATTPANFILAYHDGTNANLVECVAGVYTSKIAAAATYSAGAALVVVRNGTEARLFYNNAAVGTLQTMTANTNTLHGVFSTIATNTLDNFVLYARGTGGEYSYLDRFIK